MSRGLRSCVVTCSLGYVLSRVSFFLRHVRDRGAGEK